MAVTTKEVNKSMDRKAVKTLGVSTEVWLVLFFAVALFPVFNVIAIPVYIIAAVLALAIYVAWRLFRSSSV